jgi:hypothetical protein
VWVLGVRVCSQDDHVGCSRTTSAGQALLVMRDWHSIYVAIIIGNQRVMCISQLLIGWKIVV